MNLLDVLIIVLAMIWANKVENHFQYLKIINPRKFENYNSLVDAIKEMENNDIKLLIIGKKVIKNCLWFYIILISLFNSSLKHDIKH